MRLKLSNVCFVTFVTMLLAQEASAGLFCEIFNNCPKTTTPVPSSSASVPLPSSSTPLPVSSEHSSSALPTPTSSSIIPSSSKSSSSIPSATPTSSSAVVPSSTFLPTMTTAQSSSTTSSATPSATTSQAADTAGSSNIGAIVGSVCGFIAIIGAGFAYAFFSKTRRRNNRNKRLYSENEDVYHGDNTYQTDPFANHNARPSPAIAAAAAVAADDIHGHNNNQYQPYNYGNMAPQPPMATITKQHDPYYSTGPSPQMGYAADPYYNNSQQQYYDPNAGYYEQQQHYDQHYVDSNKQQYDPYSIPQHHSPVLTQSTNNLAPTTNSTVYSAPHSYPDENHTPNTAHSNAGYR